ncbi:MAG: hypothetical protein ACR2HG_01465 [Pyrinomonadaceae bacterium]
MKRFYFKFRIMLMTFALGLASVFVFNGSLKYSDEVFVNLPKVESDSVIFITPKKQVCMFGGGGSHWSPSPEFINEWKLNCLENNSVTSK